MAHHPKAKHMSEITYAVVAKKPNGKWFGIVHGHTTDKPEFHTYTYFPPRSFVPNGRKTKRRATSKAWGYAQSE